jgi:hypothetical protein
MLDLRRRLALPDKSTDWQIRAVVSRQSPDATDAEGIMARWIKKVLAEREQLGPGQMDEVIRGMTERKRSDRSTIDAVVKALRCGGQDQDGS